MTNKIIESKLRYLDIEIEDLQSIKYKIIDEYVNDKSFDFDERFDIFYRFHKYKRTYTRKFLKNTPILEYIDEFRPRISSLTIHDLCGIICNDIDDEKITVDRKYKILESVLKTRFGQLINK